MIDPVLAISIFVLLSVFGILLFRPGNGFYWLIKNSLKRNKKVITEDILKQLYHLEYIGRNATLNDLVGSLKIKHRQIVDIITEMETKKLIHSYEGNLKLNPIGRDYALRIIRVHRLWEKYLAEKTGVDKSEWHNRAEYMEHQLDSKEADALADQLGNPRFDPHGDPIPTDKGEIASHQGKPLSAFPVDLPGRIIHIEDEPEVIYKQIIAEDLHIGSQIRVVESNERRIRFHSEGEEFVLAPIVAANIGVIELGKQEELQENVSRLSGLKVGEKAKVIGISNEYRGAGRRRLLDLGFVPGTTVVPDFSSPLNDPKAYLIRETIIALRNKQADLILVKKINSNERSTT